MICTAWNNGKHLPSGAGYGLKVPIVDRDTHFDRKWKKIVLEGEFKLQVHHLMLSVIGDARAERALLFGLPVTK